MSLQQDMRKNVIMILTFHPHQWHKSTNATKFLAHFGSFWAKIGYYLYLGDLLAIICQKIPGWWQHVKIPQVFLIAMCIERYKNKIHIN
jgi:hypothetical protein